jgi:hypothetical protein
MTKFLSRQMNEYYHGITGTQYNPFNSRDVERLNVFEKINEVAGGREGVPNQVISFDTGVGKSTIIKAHIRFRKDNGTLHAGGIIIFLSRIAEIISFIEDCRLEWIDYAIITGDNDLSTKGLGSLKANDAPVLFVTQQKMNAIVQKGCSSFESLPLLFFQGKPRPVRFWDEAYEGATAISLSWDKLSSFPERYRGAVRTLAEYVDSVSELVASSDSGDSFIVPSGLCDVKLPFEASLQDQKLLSDLKGLASSSISVFKDKRCGVMLCGFAFSYPADIAPLFIFDAAARVTTRYQHRADRIGDIERLATIQSAYRRVTAHVWQQGASRSSLKDQLIRSRVVEGVADLVNGADEPFLIVHPKDRESDGYSIAGELRRALDHPDKAHFIHWGDHHGTNAYRAIRNVVLIGIWHKPAYATLSAYMAATRLAGHEIEDGDWHDYGQGCLRENVMQAAGRGNLRNVEAGVAGDCNVYLITAARDAPSSLVEAVFPGCVMQV